MITVKQGGLPIVLSAPHGGMEVIPDCPLRVDKSKPEFETVLDTRTDELTLLIADELSTIAGKAPSVVIARFSRKYVDANRSEENGTESEAGKVQHRAYHEALKKAVARVGPDGWLVDIHGQGRKKDTIFRGTRSLQTIAPALRKDFIAQGGFWEKLRDAGFKVEPEVGVETETTLNGGFIVATYGKQSENGVNAIQLEVGTDLRAVDRIKATARKLASVIVTLLKPAHRLAR